MVVLTAASSIVASTRGVVESQINGQIARGAAQSGMERVKDCLAKNNGRVTWSDASPLRPNTDCNGGEACDSGGGCHLHDTDKHKVTFKVIASAGPNGNSYITSTGSVSQDGLSSIEAHVKGEFVKPLVTGSHFSGNKYGEHPCAIDSNSEVICEADNLHEIRTGEKVVRPRLGNGTGSIKATSISYNCATNADGDVYCWVDFPDDNRPGYDYTNLVKYSVEGVKFVSVASFGIETFRYGCALSEEGDSYCWRHQGRNLHEYGHRGRGFYEPAEYSPPLMAKTLAPKLTSINTFMGGSGFQSSASFCGRTANSQGMYCWGENRTGRLGVGFANDEVQAWGEGYQNNGEGVHTPMPMADGEGYGQVRGEEFAIDNKCLVSNPYVSKPGYTPGKIFCWPKKYQSGSAKAEAYPFSPQDHNLEIKDLVFKDVSSSDRGISYMNVCGLTVDDQVWCVYSQSDWKGLTSSFNTAYLQSERGDLVGKKVLDINGNCAMTDEYKYYCWNFSAGGVTGLPKASLINDHISGPPKPYQQPGTIPGRLIIY